MFYNSKTVYSIVNKSHIKVFIAGKESSCLINNNVASLSSPPAANVVVRVKRETPLHERAVDFDDGAILSEAVLDMANEQLFYVAQEVLDYSEGLLKMKEDGHFNALNRRIRQVSNPVEENDAVNLSYMRSQYIPAARAEADRAKNERETTERIRASTNQLKIDTEQTLSEARTFTTSIKGDTEVIRGKAEQHMVTANAHKEKAIAEANKATTEANRAHGEANRAKGYVEKYKPEVKGAWTFDDYVQWPTLGYGKGHGSIYNDGLYHKCLMIHGNDSKVAGEFRVGMWNHVSVYGSLYITGELYVKDKPAYHRGNIHISTSNPSGGADGQIWFKYS
ncbi:phage tail fiber protein [Spartinivicinus poritis]|uniref:Phage tail fiber protein n=1 Tax=Spartinivicinus poritis TaxID=2994640 RepID=A0ABT5U6V4_9GAMM|nr:phage tail fiber protein [Spartinivicinus sp. A2-2]MDE1462108.1 phage tail fiber protein [Spartinivicinus sp. A2-2]